MLPKLREGTYRGCGPTNKREIAILKLGKDGWDGYYQTIVYDTKGVKLYAGAFPVTVETEQQFSANWQYQNDKIVWCKQLTTKAKKR